MTAGAPGPNPASEHDRPFVQRPTIAIIVAVALAIGIVFPCVYYTISTLRFQMRPEDALVATCICFFASLIYIWLLHAISIITLREAWLSKAIFGAAITSILGTIAATVATNFQNNDQYPLSGAWQLEIRKTAASINNAPQSEVNDCVWRGRIIISYNKINKSYVGYAEDQPRLIDSCKYAVRAIKHVEWMQDHSMEVEIGNFVLSNDQYDPKDQLPSRVNFTMKESDPAHWAGDNSVGLSLSIILKRSDS